MKSENERVKLYSRTKPGLSTAMYSAQKRNSKRRCHSLPNYTKSQFSYWLFNQDNFELFAVFATLVCLRYNETFNWDYIIQLFE